MTAKLHWTCPALVILLLHGFAASGAAHSQSTHFGHPRIAPTAPGAVRLATYNIANLFDERDDPSLSGDEDDMNSVKPAEQKQAAAAAIRAVNPDILALQEIESFDALIEFREQYLDDMGYDHVVSIDVGAERGIEQAVLSRHPVTSAQVWPTARLGGVHPDLWNDRPNRYAGQPLMGRRSPLRVTVSIEPAGEESAPYEITLFVVHHKSGRGNEYWREAEAAWLLERIREFERHHPGANIAVLGDFNDGVDTATVQTYFRSGFSEVFTERKPGDPLTTTHESGHAWDLILVNPALQPELVAGSASVFSTPLRSPGADWRTTPPPQGWASDHLPVSVDLMPRDS